MNEVKQLRAKGTEVANFVSFLENRGVKFGTKSDIWWMRLVGMFMPDFMRYVVTTLGNTIYLPDDYTKGRSKTAVLATLAHEYVHVSDYRRSKLFLPSYVFPQLLAAFSVLAAFGAFYAPMYYFLGALVFLLPLPSPFRLYWELRGYSMSMAVEIWTKGHLSPDTYNNISLSIRGTTYWHYISKTALHRKLSKQLKKIENGDILKEQPFSEVQLFLLSHKLVLSGSMPPPPPVK